MSTTTFKTLGRGNQVRRHNSTLSSNTKQNGMKNREATEQDFSEGRRPCIRRVQSFKVMDKQANIGSEVKKNKVLTLTEKNGEPRKQRIVKRVREAEYQGDNLVVLEDDCLGNLDSLVVETCHNVSAKLCFLLSKAIQKMSKNLPEDQTQTLSTLLEDCLSVPSDYFYRDTKAVQIGGFI